MFKHLLLPAAVLGILAASADSATAQIFKFRANNPAMAPPPVIFPPAPPIPLNNNGSLQTTANPNTGLPSQVPYIYIAGMGEAARLNNNGVFIWQPRLDSDVTALMANQGNQNAGGNNGVNGMVQAYGAQRGNPMGGFGYPGPGYGYPGSYSPIAGYMGSNFGGWVTQVPQQPFGGNSPAPGNLNPGMVNPGMGNFFANLVPVDGGNGFGGLGVFGGDANPFLAFKAAKQDTDDDKNKNDEGKNDKDKKEIARKNEDADKK